MKAATGWKIFSIFNAYIVIKTILEIKANDTVLDWLCLIIYTAAGAVLLLYAFNIFYSLGKFWQNISLLFAVYSVYIIASLVYGLAKKPIVSVDGFVSMIGAMGVAVALQYFIWLGLNRYAQISASN